MTTGDPWLPHPVGHWQSSRGNLLVHAVSGPACAFTSARDPLKGFGGTLIPSSTGGVRSLSLNEVARAIGFSEAAIADTPTRELARASSREPGWQVAASVLALVEVESHSSEAAKAGNCHDPDEEYAWRQMQVWLSAWARSPGEPRTELNLRPRGTPSDKGAPTSLDDTFAPRRVGGRSRSPASIPRKKGSQALSDRVLVAPAELTPDPLRFHEGRAQAGFRLTQLDATASEAVMSKLADSTRQSYDAG